MIDRENLKRMLVRHEGLRRKPYMCPAGRLTIGVGRNLDDTGITDAEALALLENDIDRVIGELDRYLPWWKGLDAPRAEALADMCFNLGLAGLTKFRRMLEALEAGDYDGAADEMLDSRWASQVGARAAELAAAVRGCGS